MEPTREGGVIGDLTRALHGPAAAAANTKAAQRNRVWDSIYYWRRAAVNLAIIAATFITLLLYALAVLAFAGWVM